MLSQQSVAEWILSLTMPRERAQATVGDLMEAARGPVRFWMQIARTAVAFMWRGALANWRALLLNAVVGWCVWGVAVIAIDLLADWERSYRHPLFYNYYFFARVRHLWITDGAFRWWGWLLWLNNSSDRRLAGMAVSAIVYAVLSSVTGVAFVPPSLLGAVGWLGAASIHHLIRRRRSAHG